MSEAGNVEHYQGVKVGIDDVCSVDLATLHIALIRFATDKGAPSSVLGSSYEEILSWYQHHKQNDVYIERILLKIKNPEMIKVGDSNMSDVENVAVDAATKVSEAAVGAAKKEADRIEKKGKFKKTAKKAAVVGGAGLVVGGLIWGAVRLFSDS